MPKAAIRNRTAKQAMADEAAATHVVEVTIEGVGLELDMPIFEVVGQYSDYSGFGMGARDHGFYVKGQARADELQSRLTALLAESKVDGEVTVRAKQ